MHSMRDRIPTVVDPKEFIVDPPKARAWLVVRNEQGDLIRQQELKVIPGPLGSYQIIFPEGGVSWLQGETVNVIVEEY